MADNESYTNKIEAELKQLAADIAEMMRRLEVGIDREVETLRPKLKAARERFDELAKTSEEAWGDLKPGLKRAWSEVQQSLNEAASRFKNPGSKKS